MHLCVCVHVQMSGCVLSTVTNLFNFSLSSLGGVFTVFPCTSPGRHCKTVSRLKKQQLFVWSLIIFFRNDGDIFRDKKDFAVFKSTGERMASYRRTDISLIPCCRESLIRQASALCAIMN